MPTATDRISKTPDVCGGDACIRGTRITVWGLVNQRRLGAADAEILRGVPWLTPADLEAASEQLPLVERHMYGEDYLHDSLAVRLGGRAAELVVLGQGSTGAANDLAGATDLATKMVREFGLSPTLGPVGYPEGGSVFLGGGGPGMSSRPFAEATQAEIDKEVAQLLRQAEQRAIELLKGHRSELDALTSLLLEQETVDGSEVYRLAGRTDRSQAVPPVPPTTALPRVAAADAGAAPFSAGGAGQRKD
jgi:cell division protease FtsH